ncbi:MAG: homoaconitase [Candidatus Krumholzibacteriia bacterium]
MAQTVIEKIVQSHAVGLDPGQEIGAGDYVTLVPDHVMTHDNTSAVMGKFKGLGVKRVKNPGQPVFTLDHNIQDLGESNQAKYQAIADFAARNGVTAYPAGRGIGHQIMVEEGYVRPGGLCVASDSHSNTYGALAALGTPVVRTDAAALWATGTVWWQVPPTVKVTLKGKLRTGVTGKDVIITLCGMYNRGEVLNAVIEFAGEGVASLSMEERLTIANMTTEWGALAGWFPCDAACVAYMRERKQWLEGRGTGGRITDADLAAWTINPPASDPDAVYAAEIILDLDRVTPQVSGPDTVQVARPLADLQAERVKIHKAYLLSCTNARLNDLEAAAAVIKGRKVADGVELYVSAASEPIEQAATKSGAWQALLDAGARPLPSGCGPCIGLGVGLLEPGEVGISATNRNFKGRMGSRDARAYLASPAVVAASAVAGYIAGPEGLALDGSTPERSIEVFKGTARETGPVAILPGFPSGHQGRILYLPTDNLNTDGIYGKDYTYREDMTPEMMAKVVMENYDPAFAGIVQAGDVVVAGYNFGTGSSREQAATALMAAGIKLVIAGTYSQTYLRNAINNGFVCVECPEFCDALKDHFAAEAAGGRKTIVDQEGLALDFAASRITWRGRTFRFTPLGKPVQEVVIAGGVENMVRQALA